MALITCPECGKDVSSDAANCPNCGKKLKRPVMPYVKLGISAITAITALCLFTPLFLKPQTFEQWDLRPAYLIVISVSVLGLASAVLQGINCAKHVRPLNTIGSLLSSVAIILFFFTFAFSTEIILFVPLVLAAPVLTLWVGMQFRN